MAGCFASKEDPEVLLERGMLLMREGNPKEAIAVLNRGVEKDPTHPSMHFELAMAHAQLEQLDDAIKHYSRCLEIDPTDGPVYTNRAALYARKGDFENAIADCDRAIEINSSDALAFRNRGVAFLDSGQHKRAVDDLTTAISIAPGESINRMNRAVAYSEIGDRESALNDLEAVLVSEPDHLDALVNRGILRSELGQFDGAMADFAAAKSIDPEIDIPVEIRSDGLPVRLIQFLESSGYKNIHRDDDVPALILAMKKTATVALLLKPNTSKENPAIRISAVEWNRLSEFENRGLIRESEIDGGPYFTIKMPWNIQKESLVPVEFEWSGS